MLLSAAAQAQNLVQNGDFETLHNPKTGEALSTAEHNYAINSWSSFNGVPGLDNWTSTSSISFVVGAGHGGDPTRSLFVMTTDKDSGYSCRLAGPANGFNNGLAAASPAGGNYVALDGTTATARATH